MSERWFCDSASTPEELARSLKSVDMDERLVWACSIEPSDQALFEELCAHERAHFPEVDDLLAGVSDRFIFVAVLSVETGGFLHAMRVCLPNLADERDLPFLVADLVGSGQGVDRAALDAWCGERGVRLNQCPSVESFFRISKLPGSSSALAAYAGTVAITAALGYDGGIFAHLNRASRYSFRRGNLLVESILGRQDLRTPGVGGGFDRNYEPVYIPRPENEGPIGEMVRARPLGLWYRDVDDGRPYAHLMSSP